MAQAPVITSSRAGGDVQYTPQSKDQGVIRYTSTDTDIPAHRAQLSVSLREPDSAPKAPLKKGTKAPIVATANRLYATAKVPVIRQVTTSLGAAPVPTVLVSHSFSIDVRTSPQSTGAERQKLLADIRAYVASGFFEDQVVNLAQFSV